MLDSSNDGDGPLTIIDYKTTSDNDCDARYSKQITIYASAGEQEGLHIGPCYIHELKNSKRETIETNPQQRSEVTDWAEQKMDELASGAFPINTIRSKCEACDFRVICKHSRS